MKQINVKIYGIGTEATATLHNMLDELLDAGYNMTIKQVEDIDEMMDKKLRGIPALSINGDLVFQDTVPSKIDLQNWIYSYLFKHSKPMAMKNILVPVDFSDTSKNAFQFALAYAEKTGAQLQLIHAYNSPLDAANPAMLLSITEQESRINESLAQMILNQKPNSSSVLVTFESRLGFAVDEIVKISDDPHTDMIIMGTMGEHMAIEKVFGTVSSDVSQQAKCPVMLIPPDIKFDKINDILFASDYTATEGHALDKILKFARTFNSALHFVHINDKPDDLSTSPEELIFEKVFAAKDPETPMYFAEIKDTSVTDGLNNYISNHKIDLLTVVTQKRTFWERLFHKSTTKRMVLNSEIPLLVLHV